MARIRSYRGLTALVTGASSGIGRLLAARLAREGARLALVARRAGELEKLAGEIRAQGGEARALACDVGDAEQVVACAESALEHFGEIDILVNNAGYGRHRTFLEWDYADIERMTRVNYLGAVAFTKALLPQMVERGAGWLVFVSSVAGRIATPLESAYAATKFALVGLAGALSMELEDLGIHVLTVCPGAIRTPFFDPEELERLAPITRRQMVEPEGLVDAMLAALARGRRELTYPRSLAASYAVQALVPGFMRRQVKRLVFDARPPS